MALKNPLFKTVQNVCHQTSKLFWSSTQKNLIMVLGSQNEMYWAHEKKFLIDPKSPKKWKKVFFLNVDPNFLFVSDI